MSFAIELPRFAHGQMLEAASQRRTRVFALTLAASVVLHVAAIVLGPSLRRADESPPRPLEVSLVRPPLPEPVRPPPRVEPRPPEPLTPVARPQPQQAPRQPAPVTEQRQVLALPEASAPAPSTFTVPQASVEPPAPAAEAKPAPPAPVAAAREVASTPAIYNASYLRNTLPPYPLIARRNGVEGTVRLKVLVSKDGKPMQVQLDQSSGSAALDSAALQGVRTWQFVPARRGQEPIESWVLVPVVFRLDGPS